MIVRGSFGKLYGYNEDACTPTRHWFASHWPFRFFIKHKTKRISLKEAFNKMYE